MSTTSRTPRQKLSTTVSSESYEFLREMVEQGKAATIAEALDIAVSAVRRIENRRSLAAATARYFDQMDAKTATEERSLAGALATASGEIDFDSEI
ncbi:MAG TPA: hypothetical protein VN176_10470 [Verrucomicrobiae bacterium]|nr:hypothetical protein [Verrucomicrobiae bacterium]